MQATGTSSLQLSIEPFLFEEVDTTTIFAPRMTRRGEEASALDIYDQVSQTVFDADDDGYNQEEDQFQIQPTPIGAHGQIVVVPELSVQNDSNLLFDREIANNILTLLSSKHDKDAGSSSPGVKKRRFDHDDYMTTKRHNSSPSCHHLVATSSIGSLSSEAPSSVTKKPRTALLESCHNTTKAHHQLRSKWDMRLQDLLDYKRTHGHCRVPNVYLENPSLAQWVKRQRYQYKLKTELGKHSTLTDERQEILDSVGFVWKAHECMWMERWNELKAFFLEHGHSRVPTKYPQNHQLSLWVKCQRRQYKLYHRKTMIGGVQSNMTEERMRKLEALNFTWKPRGY